MTSKSQTPTSSNASKTSSAGNNTKGGLAQMNKTASSAAKPNNSAGANSGNTNSNNLFAKVGQALKNMFGGGNKK
jgi:hypothetical protein